MTDKLDGDTFKRLFSLAKIKKLGLIYVLLLIVILFVSAIYLVNLNPYKAGATNQFVKAKVVAVSQISNGSQNVKAKVLQGSDKGRVVNIGRNYFLNDPNSKRLPIGSQVILTVQPKNGDQYSFLDRYRLGGALTLLAVLMVLVVIVGRWRGTTAAVGLVCTITILASFVMPRIINGDAAFATCIEGALMIATITIFVAHGFNRRTSLAFVSTIITLLLVIGVAASAVYLTGTTGNPGATVNSEENVPLLQYAPHYIDLEGLFLGAMVIASLGILEDITTGQAAAVDEIHKANPKLSSLSLYKKGLSVGREHIAALINTLAILYAGAALPTLVLTFLYTTNQPLAVTLNDETIMEAIVRTIVPSIGLLLAVPLSTGLAAFVLPRWYKKSKPTQ